MAAGKKARADPILDYEQKAFRLEQMLAELRDEMVSSQSHIGPHEAREMHLVVDNLTSSLRDTQVFSLFSFGLMRRGGSQDPTGASLFQRHM